MGIYTDSLNNYSSSRYTDVQPFVGENFNYHELGILAASEIAANHNSFMKSIALSELAAFEQTGSTDVLYESVNFKGIFEKIKMFFKKIIEKIHKIFHTFIAKMSAWFGNNASFARKYEKEIVKKWADVKNDWEFKGYIYKHLALTADTAQEDYKVKMQTGGEALKAAIENVDLESFNTSKNITSDEDEIKRIREKLDDIKEGCRKHIVDGIANDNLVTDIDVSQTSGYDASEFSEELFKVFRNGEDSKESIEKNKILESYGGSISGMMTYIKEFDKVKSKLESAEKKITKCIDNLIKKISKSQDDLIKKNHTDDATKNDPDKVKKNEVIVQASSLIQSLYGCLSEFLTQAFSALLQAQKEACTQAKEIAVKVIGQSKKMTEESYDYNNDSSYDTGFDFISSVKLV